jgi:hypothetical protein
MDDYHWRTSANPYALLSTRFGRVSDRKFLLFACACVRRDTRLLEDRCARLVLEMLEDYADERIGAETVLALSGDPVPRQLVVLGPGGQLAEYVLACAVRVAARTRTAGKQVRRYWPEAQRMAREAAERTEWAVGNAATTGPPARRLAVRRERQALVSLCHDVFGNPFDPAKGDPSWLAWARGLVGTMAHDIYKERRFEEMPILADALEEAGCTDARVLTHARQRAGHVRGCWLLDMILPRSD